MTIVTADHVLDVLRKIRFAPSCTDMGWTWEVTPAHGDAPGFLLRTSFRRPDRDTSLTTFGFGRWWHVAEPTTENAIVKTAFAAAKMILEHELMESFHYLDVRLFDPHHDLDDLRAAAVNRAFGMRRPVQPKVSFSITTDILGHRSVTIDVDGVRQHACSHGPVAPSTERPCGRCGGTGVDEGYGDLRCRDCDGVGRWQSLAVSAGSPSDVGARLLRHHQEMPEAIRDDFDVFSWVTLLLDLAREDERARAKADQPRPDDEHIANVLRKFALADESQRASLWQAVRTLVEAGDAREETMRVTP